jgi:tRNA pseudouridine55 synthase
MPTAGDVSALLLFDKPAGVTSHDVVAQVRRDRGTKTGHAGTLDPFATGLLLILLGRATRLQRYMVELSKTYRATARLGWRSTTGDPEGELAETGKSPDNLALPIGRITQRVPITSAVKVDGERLYRKAHRGEQAELPEREVEVYRAELLETGEGTASYEIECSSGTYVRTLIETLGDAYCESLRRVAVGPFSVQDSGSELTAADALAFMPERDLSAEEAEAVAHGRAVEQSADSNGQTAAVRLMFDGRLLAVARPDEYMLKPEVVLA